MSDWSHSSSDGFVILLGLFFYCWKVLSSPSSIEVAQGFDFGTKSSWKEFYSAPIHPPPVTSSVLQLVSEWVRSLVIHNWLCDPKATWRKALSRLWFSMVKISVIRRTEQGTTCWAKNFLFGRSYKQGTWSRQRLRMQPKLSCKGMRITKSLESHYYCCR
jgi:hypothetical protein